MEKQVAVHKTQTVFRYFSKMFGLPKQEQIEAGKHRTHNFIRGSDGLWRLKKRSEMHSVYPNFLYLDDPSFPKSVYDIGTVCYFISRAFILLA